MSNLPQPTPRLPGASSQGLTVVVGAGLAGLTCAKVLAEAGRRFLLLEASGGPGGRVASRETAQGYVLDRGFQVLLDSYPAARRHLDWRSLGGGCFRSGALFVGDGALSTLENPLRHPAALGGVLRGGVLRFADKLRLLGLLLGALQPGGRAGDQTTGSLLRSWGFSDEFLRRFAVPFFGGVLLDPALGTRSSLLQAYLRRFATGRAWIPAGGIAAVPRQLASRIPEDCIRYRTRVAELEMLAGAVRGVRLEDGSLVAADFVVLATDEPSTCRLLGRGQVRAALGTAVHYFAAEEAWYGGAWLCLPPRDESSPVLHAALLTNVHRGLAPEGRHLWSVTVLPGHPRAGDAGAVAGEVASWFGRSPSALEHIAYVEVPYAVPVQPPQGGAGHPDLPDGLLLAGDAVAGASIDAVMQSGEDAAKIVVLLGAAN